MDMGTDICAEHAEEIKKRDDRIAELERFAADVAKSIRDQNWDYDCDMDEDGEPIDGTLTYSTWVSESWLGTVLACPDCAEASPELSMDILGNVWESNCERCEDTGLFALPPMDKGHS